tara:strand:- start:288 stop:476 length:189 start_codon:yes stop_codon:yes gene_type:complete
MDKQNTKSKLGPNLQKNKKLDNKVLRIYSQSLDMGHPFSKVGKEPKKINFEQKLIKGKKKQK